MAPNQPPLDPFTLITSLLASLVQLGVFLGVLVYGVMRWNECRPRFGRAALVATAILVLSVPAAALGALYMDLGAMLPKTLPAGPSSDGLMTALRVVMLAATLVTALLTFLHNVLMVPVVALLKAPRPAFPLLFGETPPFAGVGLAAAIGVGFGVLSYVLFVALDVQAGELMKWYMELYPGVDFQSPGVVAGVLLPFVLSAALAEELTYRGVIQPFIARILGDGRAAFGVSLVVTSLLWALAHSANADNPALKIGQIFVLGLAFGGLARRFSIEAAMVAHLGLNLTVMIPTIWELVA